MRIFELIGCYHFDAYVRKPPNPKYIWAKNSEWPYISYKTLLVENTLIEILDPKRSKITLFSVHSGPRCHTRHKSVREQIILVCLVGSR